MLYYVTAIPSRSFRIHTERSHIMQNAFSSSAGTGIADNAFPSQITLAQAYVPRQGWETPLPPEDALEAGTVFPSLVLPFMKGKGGAHDADDVQSVFLANAKG
jgi:hypothetical protein